MIDGASGEGGGQILRTSLALSLVSRVPFRMIHIRQRRSRPGLLRQHLTAVRAAAAVGHADVEGAELSSSELVFAPRKVSGGSYQFSVGTAGSATLVFQTILPALLTADSASELVLEGGTHNPSAPTFDFLERAFLPLICRMGPRVQITLDRPGFVPRGGGRFRASIEPSARLSGFDLVERGPIRSRRAVAAVAGLPRSIAEREIATLQERLRWPADCFSICELDPSTGPGNVVTVDLACDQITEVFTGFGQRGVTAEKVARRAAAEVRRYLDAGVPVGVHLADQLLLPLAMAGGGRFLTLGPSSHTRTQIDTLRRFLDVEVEATRLARDRWDVEVRC